MIVFRKTSALQKHITFLKSNDQSIGFAPTMGALHEGHASLMAASNTVCDITVCSIFVNPTQFNEQSDLDKYPVTTQSDLNLLLEIDVDIVFLPGVAEIYPNGGEYIMPYNLGSLANVMEGAKRPGHFEGVVQVVDRLLDIVQPTTIFMGQKDYQQFSIIQRMLDLKDNPVELHVCPIIREEDGLAKSSRNVLLSDQDRIDALSLSRALRYIEQNKNDLSVGKLIMTAKAQIDIPNINLEYLSIVDGRTLQALKKINPDSHAVALVAAWVGKVRLIDNIILSSHN